MGAAPTYTCRNWSGSDDSALTAAPLWRSCLGLIIDLSVLSGQWQRSYFSKRWSCWPATKRPGGHWAAWGRKQWYRWKCACQLLTVGMNMWETQTRKRESCEASQCWQLAIRLFMSFRIYELQWTSWWTLVPCGGHFQFPVAEVGRRAGLAALLSFLAKSSTNTELLPTT